MRAKLLLFDLDGTLLRSDKTVSRRTLEAVSRCRERGLIVAVATSRSEQNAASYLADVRPDALIASGGALVRLRGETILRAEFSPEETLAMVAAAREICGAAVELTADTAEGHFWNWKVDPAKADAAWGDSIFDDVAHFSRATMKLCVLSPDPAAAEELARRFPASDCQRFSDGDWYKFTPKSATKEHAILALCGKCGAAPEEAVAFGDDWADIGMLRLCGTGVAMGNAIPEVKAAADAVIGTNDEDGITVFLEEEFLR